MEKSIEIKLTPELITRISQEQPKRALKELIWNSCDADAKKILINCEINDLGGIKRIKVEDDGHGIEYNNVDDLFGDLGRSYKKDKPISPGGRCYHGKLGQGRYKSLSLGEYINWKSYYNNEGEIFEFDILCQSDDLKTVSITSAIKSDKSTSGVIVTIDNVDELKVNSLLNEDEVKSDLLSTFASYLIAYKDIEIYYNEFKLEPNEHIQDKKEKIIEYFDKASGKTYYSKVLIIKWSELAERKIYICGEKGVVYQESSINNSKQLPISIYLMSSYFDELNISNTMTSLDNGYRVILDEANEFINSYIREELSNLAVEQVNELKKDNIYPYEGEANTEVEKVERQIFDILTVEINRYSPKIKTSNKETKKLTYRLIKEALKNSPDSVTKILTEVFSLSEVQQDELAELLEFTTLPSIINTAKIISDRLLFLNGLEKIIYDDEVSKPIRERTQFHKILLNELWIFGEKYIYGADDISLKNVLKEYISSLGREDLIPHIPKEAISDLTRIPDICLWQQYPNREESVENLIIELKRPSCVLTKKELDQIEDYAYEISNNKVFPKDKTQWRFLLIAKDYNDFVKFKLKQSDGKGQGNYYNSEDGSISISVKRWSDLILENKLKYGFLKEKLKYKIDNDEQGLDYVKNKYKRYFKQ